MTEVCSIQSILNSDLDYISQRRSSHRDSINTHLFFILLDTLMDDFFITKLASSCTTTDTLLRIFSFLFTLTFSEIYFPVSSSFTPFAIISSIRNVFFSNFQNLIDQCSGNIWRWRYYICPCVSVRNIGKELSIHPLDSYQSSYEEFSIYIDKVKVPTFYFAAYPSTIAKSYRSAWANKDTGRPWNNDHFLFACFQSCLQGGQPSISYGTWSVVQERRI